MLSMAPKSRVRFAQYADRRLLYIRRVALSARTAARRAADKVMFVFSVYSLPQADTALYNADTANQTILVVWFAVSVFFILVCTCSKRCIHKKHNFYLLIYFALPILFIRFAVWNT